MTWLLAEVNYYAEKTSAPGVSDDINKGYVVSDMWLDETNDIAYQCLDNTAGAAVWNRFISNVTLIDDSMADALHRHSELSGSDGTPNPALSLDADGNVTLVANLIIPDGGTIGQAAGPLLAFDNTNNFLGITGCKIGAGTATPDVLLHISSDVTGDSAVKVERTATGRYGYFEVPHGTNSPFSIGGYDGTTRKDVIQLPTDADVLGDVWIPNGNVGLGGETAPETLLELTSIVAYLTLHNSTHEDPDGGRETRLNFKGEQSGGEESTLARIEVCHDGAADDQKGKVVISTNDGDDGDTPTDAVAVDSAQNLIVPKTSGKGIKVDLNAPTFGWRDLLGKVTQRNTGASKPTHALYRGTLRQFQFAAGKEEYFTYHIDHDHLLDSDIFLHVHWSHIGAFVTGGTITIEYELAYAKGFNRGAFSVPVSTTFPGTASAVQYQHVVSEIQISAASPDANQIDSNDLEPDGIIEARIKITSNDITVSEGAVPNPFIHEVDIHYQSTNIGTKSPNPDFYT